MNGVSLFSGVGGLELALHQEVKTVAYVEREPYAQAVLIKRMREGYLDSAPIYDDVRTFQGERYRGQVDIVFGGFPCQDISVAGKGAGIKEGTRSGLFYELMRVVGEVQPTFVFLENVSAILGRGADTVLGELSQAGYDSRWTTIFSTAVGTHHQRIRWFALAYSSNDRLQKKFKEFENGFKCYEESSNPLAPHSFEGTLRKDGRVWPSRPGYGGVVDGVPFWMDRLKCLGNAVVPQQGRLAWEILTNKKKIERLMCDG